MFGRFKRSKMASTQQTNTPASPRAAMTWDIPVLFGLMFVLSIVELGFTVDIFQYKTRKHLWEGNTEKERLAFLIFSSVGTIALAAVYCGFHFARKHLHSMLHTIFLVLSTIFWVVSGVLIHTMWGYIECGGVGQLQGGINECHELKIIEIIAWVIAGISVVATIPILWRATQRRKRQAEAHAHSKTPLSG